MSVNPSNLAVLSLLAVGCIASVGCLAEARKADVVASAQSISTAPVAIDVYRRWSDHLGQGAAPQGDADFEALAQAGYKNILTVDGAVPNVEAAKRHGLRYVHVPIGYDGVTHDEATAIVKAVKDADGPIYIHCHHGQHRGPAAAAVARIALEHVDTQTALADLKACGCKYEGLFRDVGAFKAPTADELAKVGPLPEAVVPSGLRDSMTHVDERWDSIQFVRTLGFKASADHPDIDPGHEVGMLENLLRNLQEQSDAKAKGPDFIAKAEVARAAAADLEAKVRGGDTAGAETSFKALKDACSQCHKKFRD